MGHRKVDGMNDEALQKEIVVRFEELKRSAARMNDLGAEMVNRDILKGYERIYYPNIWNHGQRTTT